MDRYSACVSGERSAQEKKENAKLHWRVLAWLSTPSSPADILRNCDLKPDNQHDHRRTTTPSPDSAWQRRPAPTRTHTHARHLRVRPVEEGFIRICITSVASHTITIFCLPAALVPRCSVCRQTNHEIHAVCPLQPAFSLLFFLK